jgi:hypothetical protein
MMELLDQLEAENPEDQALAPKVCSSKLMFAGFFMDNCANYTGCDLFVKARKILGKHGSLHWDPCNTLHLLQDLSEWACIYIKYIQILRKLETAYDQMVHPQKRLDMRKALEACIGRMLEIRHWMVKLNRGLDFVSLDDILVDLKLTPEVLEVPVPKYYIEDRAKELDDRDKFLEALVEKYNVKPPQQSPIIKIGAPLPEEEAILIIQKNERGRRATGCMAAQAIKGHARMQSGSIT